MSAYRVGFVAAASLADDGLDRGLAADLPTGGAGDDTLEGGSGSDSLSGLAGNDLLYGGPGVGADTLSGGLGDDTLEGGRGNDVIDGGNGFDTLVFTHATDGIFANLQTSHSVSLDGIVDEDTLISIENVIGTSFNDAMLGDAAPNVLRGEGGNDTISGGAADDTISGGAGADTINGGDGIDRITGGPGVDVMAGGGDLDIFEFSAGDSPWKGLLTERDRIKDFGDIMLFHGGVTPTAANYIELEYSGEDPRTQAEQLYARGYEYIAVQVGANIEFFAPRLSLGVIFENNSINIIGLINFRTETPYLTPTTTPTMGDDLLAGVGNDTIDGLSGADTITTAGGTNYLRGGDGNDSIVGGAGFDDINGNMGNDTCVSGGGDDWVVGGRDNDSLSGGAGANLVYGNLGDDTCEGGGGADIVRGGQDNDSLSGGDGHDYVSGDRGADTVSGGAGADIFHTFADAGIDRVLDFNAAEGDRVQLDQGTVYTVAQVGADTVISMTGGGQMILVGVQSSSLGAGWIFGA